MLLSNDDIRTITKHALTIFLPVYGLPIAVGVFVALYLQKSHPRRIFITCLLVGSFVTMTSLDIQQQIASYRTSTEYGASGKDEVVEMVRHQTRSGDSVAATPQFTYELRDRKSFQADGKCGNPLNGFVNSLCVKNHQLSSPD